MISGDERSRAAAARPPGRRRPRPAVHRRRSGAALARPVHRRPDVAPALGARRARPQRLHLQRHRHDRGLRLGPGHRHPPPGHRPAQRHAPRRAAARRRDGVVVRRHRRRRVRALGRRAVRRPRRRRRPAPRRVRASRTATRPGWRSAARLVAAGTSTDDGTRIWLAQRGGPARGRLRARRGRGRRRAVRRRDAARDLALRARRPRHPALRVVRTADGGAVAEKSDGPGRGPRPRSRSPRSRATSGCCCCTSGTAARSCWSGTSRPAPRPSSRSTCPASSSPTSPRTPRRCWSGTPTPPAPGCTATTSRPARSTALDTAPGCVGLGRRPPGRHGRVLLLVGGGSRRPSAPCTPTARTACCSPRPARRAPGSVPVEDLWVDGPGGRVHALVARPGRSVDGPAPAVVSLHGGPHAADEDRFSAVPRAVGGRRVRRRRGQLPRLDGLRLGVARRDRGPARG